MVEKVLIRLRTINTTLASIGLPDTNILCKNNTPTYWKSSSALARMFEDII
jgi:hypothetical protein